ncbi:crotonase/enoyl-CoA hydratase family protein [Alkanindiges sp. WGS2144]|uniref:crotonase/enoyl-CoA hydratase family protein n=1 Tax=Alkanindiges sp. WGS2144 TaxID=3366808 RepID=UPI0037503493
MALVSLTRIGAIAHVQLNRPEKRNAMSFALLHELVKTAKHIKKDKDIRVVVLSGQGEAFSAGIDLSDLNNPKNMAYASWELLKPGQSIFQKANLIWQTLPVPVIAALHGHCLGAGMQLALGADIRICHPECKLSIMESRWGLVPDMGLTRSIKDIIPLDLAKELTFTGRIFDGQYAKNIGLVTHINEDPLAHAMQLAEELVQRSPDALLAGKRVLDAMAHQPRRSLRLEKLWQFKLMLGKNSRIARIKDKKPEVSFEPRQFG